jgi:hypothetical protein
MSAGLVVMSCPTRSAQGPEGPGFYPRFPTGNAPGGAQLEAAANDTAAAAGNLVVGTPTLTIIFPQNEPLGVGLQALFTMSYIGTTADVQSFSIVSGLTGDMTAAAVPGTQTGNFTWTPSAAGTFTVEFEFIATDGTFGTGSITFVVN